MLLSKQEAIRKLKAARRVSVPLVAWHTADIYQATEVLRRELEPTGQDGHDSPVITWDCVRGLVPLNTAAIKVLAQIGGGSNVTEPLDALLAAGALPAETVTIFHNLHLYLRDKPATLVQALLLLRSSNKAAHRTTILCQVHLDVPAELTRDIVVIEEPLPDDHDLAGLVDKVYSDTRKGSPIPEPGEDLVRRLVDAGRGMAHEQAELAYALGMTRSGCDPAKVWDLKRAAVNAIPGLSFEMGGPTFEQVGGQSHVKELVTRVMNGKRPPRIYVRIDEAEKQGAGQDGDSSGVAQYQLLTMLSMMQDWNWTGLVAHGVPGTGKSLLSKSAGATFGRPTLAFDPGACRGKHVGESEQMTRDAMQAIASLAGPGGAFFILTVNSTHGLKPELVSRLRYGVYFFDLPEPAEQLDIWRICLDQFGLPAFSDLEASAGLPDFEGWTGRDIRNCCELADDLTCSPAEASKYMLPMVTRSPGMIQAMRAQAAGAFHSVSYPGAYRIPSDRLALSAIPVAQSGRSIQLD